MIHRSLPRQSYACAALVLALLAAAPFSDPAPPAVVPLLEIKSPQPMPQGELNFHAPPKVLPAGAITSDWPSFLGPTHNGISSETKLLNELGKSGPPMVWEVKKGSGYAAPAVFKDRLVFFHRMGDEEVIECLQAETGRQFWKAAYPTDYQDRYGYSEGPRCAPVIDSGRVYTFGAGGMLHCLDLLAGHVYWKRDILKEFKLKQNFFGVGATPLVEGDLLIINIGADGGPCVVAFDKKTGKMVWGAGDQWGPSYASPIPADIQGKRRVFVFAGGESHPPTGGLLCIDPSNGAVDFSFPWRGRRVDSVNASSPLIVGNQVFISECYGRGSALLDIAPDFSAKPAWTNEDFGTHFMTAIHKDGYLYGVHGHGPLDCPIVCLELKTGKEMWRHEPEWSDEIQTPGGLRKYKFSTNRANFLLVDGRCLCLTESGHLLWLDLNPKGYKELSRCSLFLASETWTPPVLSRGLLYINQNNPDNIHRAGPRVICYDLRGG